MPRRPRNDRLVAAFAQRVRAMRVDAGLSQEAMAEKSGLSRTYIYHLESAGVTPSLDTITRVARALGRDAGELVTGLERIKPL